MYRHSVVMTGVALGFAALSIGAAVAQTASAPSDDVAYCNALARKYERYMPMRSYGESRGSSPSVETMVAVTQCNNGRSAEAIPVLEKALRGAGFSVPERSIGSRPQ
ncbi:MAG TPA: hypothetical protein VJR58_20670 [Vineibacter sp.]|nr:hypothetical protein [Vineibacter sp.]